MAFRALIAAHSAQTIARLTQASAGLSARVAGCQAGELARFCKQASRNPVDEPLFETMAGSELVLLDFENGDQQSLEIVRHLRRSPQFQHLGLVALVSDGRPSSVQEALVSGFDDVLTMPETFTIDHAALHVRMVLGSLARQVRLDQKTAAMALLAAKAHVRPYFEWVRHHGALPIRLDVRLSECNGGLGQAMTRFAEFSEFGAGGASANQTSPPHPIQLWDLTALQQNPEQYFDRPSTADRLILVDRCEDFSAVEFQHIEQALASDEAVLTFTPFSSVQLRWRLQALRARASWRQACFEALSGTLDIALNDALTGLFNRKHLNVALPSLMRDARMERRSIGLIGMDMNGFKAINDTHGHPTGDALIAALGGAIDGAVRAQDFAVRTGGDEFLVVLPEASAATLQIVQSRLVDAVERTEISAPDGSTIAVGVSCGAYLFDHRDWTMTPQLLLAKVDQLLYQEKRRSRTRRQAVGGR